MFQRGMVGITPRMQSNGDRGEGPDATHRGPINPELNSVHCARPSVNYHVPLCERVIRVRGVCDLLLFMYVFYDALTYGMTYASHTVILFLFFCI